MKNDLLLETIPDDELLRRLAALLAASRHTEADLVAHIGEVDARRLYLREATPSMFQYCTERLHLSGAEAYLGIAVARTSREHPVVLEMLADGRLHLTGIALLAPHLTPANRDCLLERATHRTKREIEELLAELSPRPDAPTVMRRLPERRSPTSGLGASCSPSAGPAPRSRPAPPEPGSGPASQSGPELRPDAVASIGSNEKVVAGGQVGGEASPTGEGRPCGGNNAVLDHGSSNRIAAPVVEPLSPARYRVQFTASAELRDKLERLKALMHSSVPDGDLAAIIDAAVSEKLERLEARRFGRTRAPTRPPSASEATPSSRHVPAAVRRAVHERDQGRCRYVDEEGRRCTARVGLEFHHRHPFALGGNHSPTNVSELCWAHNQYLARIDFGRRAFCQGPPPGRGREAGAEALTLS